MSANHREKFGLSVWILGLLLTSRSFSFALPGAPPEPMTQRRINEAAAILDRTRRAIIEDTGLRRAGEPLNIYLGRIVSALSGERPDQSHRRLESYVAALEQGATQTAPFRTHAALRDSSAANVANWHHAGTALNALPGRILNLRRVWQTTRGNGGVSSPEMLTALTQALRTVLTALDALRDARP